MTKPNIIIVGAGPSGLTMACELQRRGVECRVIDRADGIAMQSRALGVQARSLEVFEQMGVYQRILPFSRQLQGIALWSNSRQIATAPMQMKSDDSRHKGETVIPQYLVQQELAKEFTEKGGRLEFNHELTSVKRNGAGFDLVIATPDGGKEEAHADWLIAADGSHSPIRKTFNIPYEGSKYAEFVLIGDVEVDWSLPPDHGYVFMNRDGTIVTFPYHEDGRWRMIDATGKPEKQNFLKPNSEETIAWFQNAFGREVPNLKIKSIYWHSIFKFQRAMVPAMRHGNLFIVGDAAHTHSPAGGEGLNTGLGDSFNLAWKLAGVVNGEMKPAILDSFNAERIPVAANALAATHRFTKVLVFMRNPIVAAIRNIAMRILFNMEGSKEKFARSFSKLDMNYRESPAVLDHGAPPPEGTRAGDRIPDILFGAQSTRLHDLLRDPQHHLVLVLGSGAAVGEAISAAKQLVARFGKVIVAHVVKDSGTTVPAGVRGIDDTTGVLRARLSSGGVAVYLVRPDQMIAYRAADLDQSHLLRFMDGMFYVTAS